MNILKLFWRFFKALFFIFAFPFLALVTFVSVIDFIDWVNTGVIKDASALLSLARGALILFVIVLVLIYHVCRRLISHH